MKKIKRGPDRAGVAAGLFLFLAVAALFPGCQARRHALDPGKAPLIGFSLDSLVVERWKRDMDVFGRSARELGAEVLFRVADQDPVVQENQIRELAAAGIDVLVIVPNDADKLCDVVKEVREKGIPVLSYDRLVRRAGVDLYVSFDNVKVGALMAEAATRAAPSSGVIVVNGARSDNNAALLGEGIHQVLDARAEAGEGRIVAEFWPSAWASDEVKDWLESAIATSGDFGAVIAGNDMLAEAAIGVLSERRLAGRVKVVGQDADLAACQRIAEGTQYATVYKPIERLALRAAGFAVMLARGEAISVDATMDDGKGKVPYVRLEPILVTRELLESTVIKDGFHAAKDVYRFSPP